MRKNLILAFLLLIGVCNAQQEIYQKVCALIKQTDPELIMETKLLVINFDVKSDQINKTVYTQLEKTATTYEFSKLKGGRKGVVCVSIIQDTQTEIVLNKESYKKIIKIKASDLENINSGEIKNIAFNSTGTVIFKNVSDKDIYESVHQLITR